MPNPRANSNATPSNAATTKTQNSTTTYHTRIRKSKTGINSSSSLQ